MHVTFLLGNGFDLNVGLKTSYRDFLNVYLKQRGGDKFARHCRQRIRQAKRDDQGLWSDMELALGQLSETYPEKDEPIHEAQSNYCRLLKTLKLALHQYFHTQVQRINLEENKEAICREFENTLACPFQGLQGQQLQFMREWWRRNTRTSVTYHFLNFNYTPTFELCRSLYENEAFARTGSPFIRNVGMKKIVDNMEATRHVHGALNNGLILGVDWSGQLTNIRLCDSKVQANFIKPMINRQMGNGQAQEAEKMIQQSRLIVIFGMSLGETDRTWWQIIANWLAADGQNRLIVVSTCPNQNIQIPDPAIQWKNYVRGVFQDLLGAGVWNRVQNQILTTINCKVDPVGKHLFNFSAVKAEPPKVPVNQKLQEAGRKFAGACVQTNQAFRGWISRQKGVLLRLRGENSMEDEASETADDPLQATVPFPMPESRYQTASPFTQPPRSIGQSGDTAP